MTLEECYEKMNGNYLEIVERLQNEAVVERLLLKFLSDKSMADLMEAVGADDIEASFSAVHTLKGVALNLSFTELAKAASELTEQLRPRKEIADKKLLKKVEDAYTKVINAIKEFE